MKKKADSPLKRVTGKGVFPHQWAFTLLIPLRNIFISPNMIIKRLEPGDKSDVLEVGPGPGYFSTEVAKAIKDGRIFLFDIQQEMLDYAKRRMEKRKIYNVEYHLSSGSEFPFGDGQFDRIFMVTVLGEIENREQYIREFHRVLRKGGIISISEQAGDPDRMTVDEITGIFCKHGFGFYKKYGNKRNYTVNFKKL